MKQGPALYKSLAAYAVFFITKKKPADAYVEVACITGNCEPT